MAVSPTPARDELTQKMALEQQLKKQLTVFNDELVAVVRDPNNEGETQDIDGNFGEALAAILLAHYLRTMAKFDKTQRRLLPSDVVSTTEEDTKIAMALTTFFMVQAPLHAKLINSTSQRDLTDSLFKALALLREEAPGIQVSPAELSAVTARLFDQKLKGRMNTILATETEFPAESSKNTEAAVLVHATPDISGGQIAPVELNKIWVTVADSRVRPSHVAADGQTVRVSQPFIVGGARLAFPGDASLGAPLDEIMGCRCAALYDTNQIVAIRRQRNQEPFIAVG